MRGGTYVIINDNIDLTKEFGEALSGSIVVTNNFRKAYDLALSLGEIAEPEFGYKVAIARCNKKKAVTIQSKTGAQRVTIVSVKKY